jgi:hypothetical protein
MPAVTSPERIAAAFAAAAVAAAIAIIPITASDAQGPAAKQPGDIGARHGHAHGGGHGPTIR